MDVYNNTGDIAMKKRFIHIYQCKPGYVLAEDIYDEHGILIMPKDMVITDYAIKRLETFRVRQLSVYELQDGEENDKRGGSSFEEFKKNYRNDLKAMKQLLGDLAAGRKLDYEQIASISNSVYSKIRNISNIIECMNQVKNLDEYTYSHSINVSVYSLLIARWLGLKKEHIRNVIITGILHDIGKIKIPGDILQKKGPLLPEEYETIKEHVTIGYELSKNIPQLNDEIREGILKHHEREDGKGYPFGEKGDKINLYAKIISVSDIYDALTSERVYKKRITPFDTFSELIRIGYGHLDTRILMTFLSRICCYYIGATVRVNNDKTGKVIFVTPKNISTPIVYVDGEYIDLSRNKQYKIVEMLSPR